MGFWQTKWSTGVLTNGLVGAWFAFKVFIGFGNVKLNAILAGTELIVVIICAILAWRESRG